MSQLHKNSLKSWKELRIWRLFIIYLVAEDPREPWYKRHWVTRISDSENRHHLFSIDLVKNQNTKALKITFWMFCLFISIL